MTEQKMMEHIKLLGIFYVILGGLDILQVVLITGIMSGIGSILGGSMIPILKFTSSIITIVYGVFSIPLIIGGISLLKYKSWSRIFVFILGIFNIVKFPIGTALGVYTIWILSKDECKNVLTN